MPKTPTRYFNSAFQTVSLCLAITSCFGATTPSCTQLLRTKAEQKLAYLRADRSALSTECVTYAIQQIGAAHYAPAADVLATYLDFEIPEKDKLSAVVRVTIVSPSLGDRYPAYDALFEIGKSVSPALIRVIADAGSSDLLRKNAVETLFAVHRENLAEGARTLSRASRTASDNGTAVRLLHAAEEFAAKCPNRLRSDCEAALLER